MNRLFTPIRAVVCSLLVFSLFINSAYSQAPVISVLGGLPTGNFSGKGVAYGNSAYVAIFQDGNIYRSTDGEQWLHVTDASVPVGDFNGIHFGAGLFVIVGQSGLIATSANGTNWTIQTSNTANNLYDIDFINSSFYAVGANRTIRESADGITWNTITVNTGNATDYFNSISYGNGVFALGSRTSGHSGVYIYRSTTGASNSWTFQNVVFGSINKVQFLGIRFYIFMSNANVYTSTDASTWSNSTATMTVTYPNMSVGNIGTNAQTFNGIYDGSKWYLFGYSQYHSGYGAVFSSVNGINFTLEPLTAYIVTQGSAYANGRYFVHGNEGLVGSTDGVNYQYFGGSFFSMARSGSGNYVAVGPVGSAGVLFSSSDFASWTNRTNGYRKELTSVVNDGSRFVAAGNGQVLESADGTSWSSLSAPNFYFVSMAYNAGQYVGAGYNPSTYEAGLIYSNDGITWSTGSSADNYYFRVRYVNGHYFALGYDNASYLGVIMHSTDGISWSDVTPSLGYDVAFYTDVVFDGTRYHFVGTEYANASLWIMDDFFTISTTTPANPASYANKGAITVAPGGAQLGGSWGEGVIAYSNGRFAGSVIDINTYEAYMIYSVDGVSWTAEPTGVYSSVGDILVNGNKFEMVGSSDYKFMINFSSTLPVTMSKFEVARSGTGALLTWSTLSELNSREFEVEHSVDGVRWEKLAVVAAAGNSNELRQYQYLHRAPGKGLHYYRLRQVDFDGRASYSAIRKLQIDERASLQVYPNPGSAEVSIQLPDASSARVTVFDQSGRVVYRAVHNQVRVQVSVERWVAGMYQVRVEQGGQSSVVSFMKR